MTEARVRPCRAGEQKWALDHLACQTVASARYGGSGEASETSTGVAYGFLMEEKTRGLGLQQRAGRRTVPFLSQAKV